MTKKQYQRYSAEFKLQALKRASEEDVMKRTIRTSLTIVGVLLLLTGIANIVDNARVLTYDITAIFAGIGFLLTSRSQ